MITRKALSFALLMASLTLPLAAQFGSLKTKLKPQTVAEFDSYAQQVESELNAHWAGKRAFLQIDEDQAAHAKMMSGELVVRAELKPNPRSISDGLIHDWYGAVMIPNTKLAKVLSVLEDYNHHSAIYPQVISSHLIKQEGNDFTGYWRLEEKGQMLPAVFDVTQKAHYWEIAPGKWASIAHADDIQAVEKSKTLPPGEGIGLMWKMYSYWTLEQVGTGVVAENRTISLSRGVPGGIAWMIRPLMNSIPRESMDSTLRNTRKASGD